MALGIAAARGGRQRVLRPQLAGGPSEGLAAAARPRATVRLVLLREHPHEWDPPGGRREDVAGHCSNGCAGVSFFKKKKKKKRNADKL